MMFVMMALSVAVGTLLATGVAVFIMMQPKVMKAYMKWVQKATNEIVDEMFDEEE